MSAFCLFKTNYTNICAILTLFWPSLVQFYRMLTGPGWERWGPQTLLLSAGTSCFMFQREMTSLTFHIIGPMRAGGLGTNMFSRGQENACQDFRMARKCCSLFSSSCKFSKWRPVSCGGDPRCPFTEGNDPVQLTTPSPLATYRVPQNWYW